MDPLSSLQTPEGPALAPSFLKDADRPDRLATIIASLDNSKAEDIVSIDIAGKTPIADNMVVATGRSHRHVAAISDRLISDLKDAGFGNAAVEGLQSADWVLIDAGDVVVHVFRPEVRQFYHIEKMWSAEPAAVRTNG